MKTKIKGYLESVAFFFYEYSLPLCLWISKHKKNTIVRILLTLLCFPYILVKCPLTVIYEHTLGKAYVIHKKKKEKDISFQYHLSIVLIAKDESKYIQEWLAYYQVVCKDDVHFYIYDNGSTDGMKECIQKYIDQGLVTYIDFPGTKMQVPAYNHAVKHFRNETKYMAFIDVDEFILTRKDIKLNDLIEEIISKKKNSGGIGINWDIFGSSGYKKKQEGLVIETFLRHGFEEHWGNTHVKTVCNPRLVKKVVSAHYPCYLCGAWSLAPNGERQRLWWNKKVHWDILSIHHYFCKSEEEFWEKRDKGRVSTGGKYEYKRFINYDENGYYDDVMLRYVDAVKKKMQEYQ